MWKGDGKGRFFVKELCFLLELNYVIPFPLEIIWSSWIPYKVSLLTWEAYWGKVLTLD